MKKLLFLLLLAGGVLFLIHHLTNITNVEIDKVKNHATQQLTATEHKAEVQTPAKKPETVTEQVTEMVKQATDTMNPLQQPEPSSKKPAIAEIKIYDKQTNKEIIVDSPNLLETEQKKLSVKQQAQLQQKAEKFRAFYQKPEKCVAPATQELRVQCANDYMRAKAKFEALYQQGEKP